ncbi:MAG: response regulator [Verrucomicrobiales bacterium]|nr:response regulator [Verrucomicrobiales bacterium]
MKRNNGEVSKSGEKEWLLELRIELDPAAAKLCELAQSISKCEFDSSPESVAAIKADIKKLVAESKLFHDDLASWFCTEEEIDPETFRTRMRKSRHDARNRLNHLFGAVQLIEMSCTDAVLSGMILDMVAQLEVCLSLVDRTQEEPIPGKFAPIGSSAYEVVISDEAIGSKILVADDDPENRSILERLLSPCGFEMEFAVNGKQAVEMMGTTSFDAVLLDIQMPEMDGFEVLAALRESGQLRQTPVIVVTGLQEEQDAVRCIEIGAEDFLSRPIRPALLMARLNASLEKKRLREKVFEQHFTPELARELARNPDPMKMQARQAEVSVMFCDIRRFSAISERLGPSQTVDWLSGVMGEFSTIVINHGGVLVDYTGDELLAMWGAPNEQPNHAELACKASLEILASLPAINDKWRPIVDAETEVGIGVNTGEALVGNIGTHRKFKYGPLGTTVNLASRVQGATKFLRTSLLTTGRTASKLPKDLRGRRLCQVRVQNINAPVNLYELQIEASTEADRNLAAQYELALDKFEEGNFRRASALLGDFLLSVPHDGPGLQLMSRVVNAMLNDESSGGVNPFSPIWTLPGK